MVEFGYDISESISRPRYHHQLFPNILAFESNYPDNIVEAMAAKGHQTSKTLSAIGAIQVCRISQSCKKKGIVEKDGKLLAASDPRKNGAPAGF